MQNQSMDGNNSNVKDVHHPQLILIIIFKVYTLKQ